MGSDGSRYGYIPRGKETRQATMDLNFCTTPGLCFKVVISNISINAAEDTLLRTPFTPQKAYLFIMISLYFRSQVFKTREI